MKRAKKFLWQGDKLKLVMQFRGREMAYRDAGLEKFKGMLEHIATFGAVIESDPKIMGNRIITLMSPDKKAIEKLKKEEKIALKTEKWVQETEAKSETADEAGDNKEDAKTKES